ncbi:uncharacterized protein PSFLO_04381 [Pseudozyma flocculosa]|uniref:Transmembrane protein n=1 Tax=Pseudozyma flocculosa TaxID=84751 RepID=A0A5C3F3J7_9BASI|nr:uncharacterized protein PSFLO_04381 [Pseudozyma flocculosa]
MCLGGSLATRLLLAFLCVALLASVRPMNFPASSSSAIDRLGPVPLPPQELFAAYNDMITHLSPSGRLAPEGFQAFHVVDVRVPTLAGEQPLSLFERTAELSKVLRSIAADGKAAELVSDLGTAFAQQQGLPSVSRRTLKKMRSDLKQLEDEHRKIRSDYELATSFGDAAEGHEDSLATRLPFVYGNFRRAARLARHRLERIAAEIQLYRSERIPEVWNKVPGKPGRVRPVDDSELSGGEDGQ